VAKELVSKVKLQIPAGQATPGPPVGVALGPRNVNVGDFCRQFNEQTKSQQGNIVTVAISVYSDRTFRFLVKSSPASALLKKAANLAKGSGAPNRDKVGKVTRQQLRQIAELKKNDLNAYDVETAVTMLEGTAKSMGIEVVD
jgi:large subunit ribosomal protein L11